MSIEDIKIHTNSKLFLFPILKNHSAITLGKHVFVKKDVYSDRLLRHEYIHLIQQNKLGTIYFYLFYMYCFLNLYSTTKDLKRAYRAIPFEVEAYELQEFSVEEIEKKMDERYNK